MYHPVEPEPDSPFEDDDFEYVEIANTSKTDVLNLENYSFEQGIQFTFPATAIQPGHRIVVVRNASAFRERYGTDISVAGQYGPSGSKLSNGGESIELVNQQGQVVQSLTYDDDWYEQTDGQGYSLEFLDVNEPSLDRWSDGSGWRFSLGDGGTPGAPLTPGDFDGDGRLDPDDIDRLHVAIHSASIDVAFDLNEDTYVDEHDVNFFVNELAGTRPGDTDLDGDVDQWDVITSLINVDESRTGKHWSQGDFDGDGDVDIADLEFLAGNYTGITRPAVLISEFLASNNDVLLDGNGNSSDWIELHNPGNVTVNLAGYRLTDDSQNLSRWSFPDVAIGPHGYLTLFASGADSESMFDPEDNIHANFTLNADGEYLALVSPAGRIISEYGASGTHYPKQRTDVSFGVSDPGTPGGYSTGYMVAPTPGRPNSETLVDFVRDTTFSMDRGYYDEPVLVELDTETPNSEIRFTIDGSTPTLTHGDIYTGPLSFESTTTLRAAAFKSGYIPTNTDTQTYIFFDSVVRQTKPSSYPDLNADNYDMDPRITVDSVYHDRFLEGLTTIPSLSLVLPQGDFVGPSGFYTNPQVRGRSSERPVSAEFITADGSDGFQIDAGVRIQGGASRSPGTTPKHSMSLRFRREYGAGTLDYPLFPNSPVTRFDSLSLRGGSNNSWGVVHAADRLRATYIRDQYVRDSLIDMGNMDAGRGIFAHLYINGMYWGLYNVTERPDAAHFAEYFGGEPEDYDALNGREVLDGSIDAFLQMQETAKSGDWDAIQQVIDIDSFIDFNIITTYGGNGDIDSGRNHRSTGGGSAGAAWRIYSWDAEESLHNPLSFVRGADPWNIFRDLQRHDEFQVRYGDRVHKHFFNDGALTTNKASQRWLERKEEIDLAIIGESARWGDHRRPDDPYSRDVEWVTENTRIVKEHVPLRSEVMLPGLRDLGLYPDVDAPSFNQHGGVVSAAFQLTMSAPIGTIYYTIDGSDPRAVGGALSRSAIAYSEPLSLTSNATVRARAMADGQWSALNEAEFIVASDFPLRITEINYQPHRPNPAGGSREADVDNDRFEFIELVNTANHAINLNGVEFVQTTVDFQQQGIGFRFASQVLGAGERILVVRDRAAFESRYGQDRPIAVGTDDRGAMTIEYEGKLSNDGEQLTLIDSSRDVIQQFDFAVGVTEQQRTKGRGSSLEVIDINARFDQSASWRSSSEFGGSPGRASQRPDSRIKIDEVLANSGTGNGNFVELTNLANTDVSIDGWYLTNSLDDMTRNPVTRATPLPAGAHHVIPQTELAFDLRAEGGQLWLIEANQRGKPVQFVDHVEFGPTPLAVSAGSSPMEEDPLMLLTRPTPGASNSDRLLDVVINEIMYNPPDLDGLGGRTSQTYEFVELLNPTDAEVDLFGWRLSGDIEMAVRDHITIGPGGIVVLTSFTRSTDARRFRDHYGLEEGVALVGKFVGVLGNRYGTVRLEQPSQPELDDVGLTYIVVDSVSYESVDPWPRSPVMGQESLSRVSPETYGNIGASWIAGIPSPGD